MTALAVQITQALPVFEIDVELNAPQGRLALFGPSGAGKTSILKAIAGLTRPMGGRVKLGFAELGDLSQGHWPPAYLRNTGFVFQDDRLFPHLSVAANISYGAMPESADVQDAIEMTGVETLLHRHVGDLSGGERRRVAIARALAMKPALLLLDEPYNGLDRRAAERLRSDLATFLNGSKIPFILVTHTLDDVLAHDCHVALIEQGHVAAQGSADTIFNSDVGERFLSTGDAALQSGPVTVFKIERAQAEADSGLLGCYLRTEIKLMLPHGGMAAPGSYLKIRASDVSIAVTPPSQSSILNVLPAKIIALTAKDEMTYVRLDLGGALVLTARITSYSAAKLALAPGQDVFAQIKSAALVA